MVAAEIARALGGARRNGEGWVARCPAHDDRNPSLSLRWNQRSPARLLLCWLRLAAHSDGASRSGLNAMSERDNWTHLIPVPAKAVELIRNGRNFPPWDPAWGNPKNWWLYELPDCTAIGLVVRFEKSNAEGKIKKSIIPLSYGYGSDGRSRWRWKGFPVPHPLYNLPMLTKHADAPVLIVEGEKRALALSEVQTVFVATTWPGGAKAISKADFTPLAKRAVYLWPDNDDPGHAAMRSVALTLRKLGRHLRRVEPQVDGPRNTTLQICLNLAGAARKLSSTLRRIRPKSLHANSTKRH
jgi:hypothetical protein